MKLNESKSVKMNQNRTILNEIDKMHQSGIEWIKANQKQ